MMRWNDGGSAGSWVALTLVMLAFLGVVAALFALGRRDRSSSTGEGDRGSGGARAMLDERFARGDIDAAEYTRRRDVLRSQ
jgi:putative membrane protein